MTKAVLMATTANKVNEEKSKARETAHRIYANRIVDKKVAKEASKGNYSCRAKIRRGYSVARIKECLEAKGFTVTLGSKNGKAFLNIKW